MWSTSETDAARAPVATSPCRRSVIYNSEEWLTATPKYSTVVLSQTQVWRARCMLHVEGMFGIQFGVFVENGHSTSADKQESKEDQLPSLRASGRYPAATAQKSGHQPI
jgi:hypothetical protein